MRKLVIGFLIAFSSVASIAQDNSDPELSKRLDKYMNLTRELKFEEIMEYTHPKIFAIASKEQLAEVFKQAFDNEEMSIGIDSTAIVGISDAFKLKDATYKKIVYSMNMVVRFKDTISLKEESFIGTMKMAFTNAFPGATVEFNKAKKTFQIKALNIMIAIKDNNATPWMFLGYEKKNGELLKVLYPKEVIEHFKLL
jgi:hypothetical protein